MARNTTIHPTMPGFKTRVFWTAADLRSGVAGAYPEAYDVSGDTREGRKLRADYARVVQEAIKVVEAEGIQLELRHVAGNRLLWKRAN